MANKSENVELLRKIILETIQEEIGVVTEGAIGPTVIDPMLSALKAKDIKRAKQIFKMSLSQFSADEINDEIIRRIGQEKDILHKKMLDSLKAQYAATQAKKASQSVSAGANQASLSATKQLTPAATGTLGEERVREIVAGILQEIMKGLKQGTSAGQEQRVEKMKAAHNARAAKVRAGTPEEEAEELSGSDVKQVGGATPPPVPASAKKATPPPVPASAKKMVAESTEDFIKNLVRAVLVSEMKKITVQQ